MQKTLLATYTRKSTLPHYAKSAWAYAHEIVKLECLYIDYQEERKAWEEAGMVSYDKNGNVIPNDVIRPNVYVVRTTNAKGVSHDHEAKTKEDANAIFSAFMKEFRDFRKV